MRIDNIKDVEGFFKVVDGCKGRIELVTAEGDRLNLKSKLSQYLSLANIFAKEAEIPELELRHGDNIVSVTGEGTTTFAYREGRL